MNPVAVGGVGIVCGLGRTGAQVIAGVRATAKREDLDLHAGGTQRLDLALDEDPAGRQNAEVDPRHLGGGVEGVVHVPAPHVADRGGDDDAQPHLAFR